MKRPYTIVDAFHQEMKTWKCEGAERALLMAFTYCLMLRLQGTSFDEMFPDNQTEPANDYSI